MEPVEAPDSREPDDTAASVRDAVQRAMGSRLLTPSNKPRERERALRQVDTLVKKRLLSPDPALLEDCAREHGCTREAMRQREALLMQVLKRELKEVAA